MIFDKKALTFINKPAIMGTTNKGGLFMKQRTLSLWLKAAISVFTAIVIISYALFIPYVAGKEFFLNIYPELKSWYMPWIVYIGLTAIPILAAMVRSWQIAKNIEKDNSFCHANAKFMRDIGLCAFADSVYFVIGGVIMLLLNRSHPAVFMVSMTFVVIGLVVSVAAAGLARLIENAACMKEENDSFV